MGALDDPAVSELFDELHAAGVETGGFGVFSKSAEWFDHGDAAPILLRWLPKITDSRTRESIVRSLTGQSEAESQGAGQVLVDEFERSRDDPNLGWVTGNALATLAGPSDANDLIRLLRDRRFGKSREMLCEALKRTRDTRTPSVLLEMIEDDDVAGYAVAVLRSLRPAAAASVLGEARGKLEALAERPTASPFTRKQARRALAEIDRA
jgi:hypothetical protein